MNSPWQMDFGGQTVFFVDGLIQTSAGNELIMGDGTFTSGATNDSYVQGPMWKIGNDAFTFPVGKGDTILATIRITAPSTVTDTFEAEYFFAVPHDAGYDSASKDPTILFISTSEYWILNRIGGSSNVFVTLSWCDRCRSGDVNVPADLVVARWDGAVWRDEGNGGFAETPPTGVVSTSSAVSSFSPFTLASVSLGNPLPVELLLFDVRLADKTVEIIWETLSELNISHFEVQRSLDGIDFETILSSDPKGGYNTGASYNEIDLSPKNGRTYYRLKTIDLDGSIEYSVARVIYLDGMSNESDVVLFPNPIRSGNKINISSSGESSFARAILFGSKGSKTNLMISTGDGSLLIPPDLPPGVYILELISDHRIHRENLVVHP